MTRQLRFLMGAVGAIAGIWVLAMAGHWYLASLTMTADKVRAYVNSVDFGHLSGAARARALKELEDKLNALSYDERQKLRMQHLVDGWFNEMTEDEKAQFVEATLENTKYVTAPLMLPGNEAYFHVLDKHLALVMQGTISPEEAAKKIDEGWNKITDDLGRQEQIRLWRSGVESGMYIDKF